MMADRTFTFTLPQDLVRPADRSAPIVIRNAKLAVVKRTTLDAAIDLPPGWYAAQSVLPDGQELEAAFELPATGDLDPVELSPSDAWDEVDTVAPERASSNDDDGADFGALDAAPDDFGDPAADIFAGSGASIIPDDDFGAVFGRATSLPGLISKAMNLGTRRSGPPRLDRAAMSDISYRWQFVEFDLERDQSRTLQEPSLGQAVKIEPLPADDRKDRCLRIERLGLPDVNLSVPVSFSEGATFSFVGDATAWGFELQDPDADLVFGYLAGRRVTQLAQLVEYQGPMWQRLFNADDLRPIAGIVGAYALLLVGDAGNDRRAGVDWSAHIYLAEILAHAPQAPSDAQAIFGEFLARLGRHDEALQMFGALAKRGLPVCSIGLRIVIDRLLGYQNLVERKGLNTHGLDLTTLIARVGRLANFVDFDQPVLNFTTGPDGKLGHGARREWSGSGTVRRTRQDRATDQIDRGGLSEA